MKTLFASVFVILVTAAACALLHAQEAGSGFGLTPSKPDSLLPEGQPGLPLIPNALPAPDKSRQATEAKSRTAIAEDAQQELVKLRVAKNKAQSDPALIALWDAIPKAKTDPEQREMFIKYYNQLFDLMLKIDKTLKTEQVENMRTNYVGNFNQNRLTKTPSPATPKPDDGTDTGKPKKGGKGGKGSKGAAPDATAAPAPAAAPAPDSVPAKPAGAQ